MKKDAYYFPHYSNARNDSKLVKLRRVMNIEGYGMYFMLLEVLREQTNFKLPLNIIEDLAYEWHTSKEKLLAVVTNFDLFIIGDNIFYSIKQIAYLQPYIERSKKARMAANVRWDNARVYANALPEKSTSNTSKVKESKVKERRGENRKVNQLVYPFITERFFEKWDEWKKYRKYNSLDQEQNDMSDIMEVSNGVEEDAITIIDNCISNKITNFIEESEVEILTNYSFEEFWELYDKKVGVKDKLEKKWNKFTNDTRHTIMTYIPNYIESQSDKQFRQNPETFFNQEGWNNEIINSNKNETHAERIGRETFKAFSNSQSDQD